MERKEAPSGFCFKAERKHFGAAACAGFGWGLQRERGAPGGDCGTSTASRALPALGNGQPEGALSALPPTRPLTPGGGTPWTSKGIKAGEGQATRAQLFFPSRPSSPLFCFWLLASLGSKMLAGGDLQEKACSARDTSRKTMWSAEAGNGLEPRVGVGKTGRRRVGGGRKAAVAWPKPGRRVTLNATPNIFCHPSLETLDTALNHRLGGGESERLVRVAVLTLRTRRCRKRSRPGPGPGSGRERSAPQRAAAATLPP